MSVRGKCQLFGLMIAAACMLASDVVKAQPGRGGDRGGGGRGGFGGGTSEIDLLRMESVQGELDMVDEQVESINELHSELSDEQQDYFSGLREKMRDLDEDGRREMFTQLQADVKEMRAKYNDLAKEELLPNQADRLKQLMIQTENRRGGGIQQGALSERLIEELGLTEDQVASIKKTAEEVYAELKKKVAKLEAQAVDQILGKHLSSDQMAMYKELVGDQFGGIEQQRGGFGGQQRGRGGDAGGRGGDRGGDAGGRGGDRGGRGGGGDRGGRGGGDRGADNKETDFN